MSTQPPSNIEGRSHTESSDHRAGQWPAFSVAATLSFLLLVGVFFFLFEHVLEWLGVLCYLAGIAVALKIARNQKQNMILMTVFSLFFSALAALVLLALPSKIRMPPARLTQVHRSLISISLLVLSFIVVYPLALATHQGPFRVVPTSDVQEYGPGSLHPSGENLCGKVVNVEGVVIDVGRHAVHAGLYPSGPDTDRRAVIISSDGDPFDGAQVLGASKLPLPKVKERLHVNAVVKCTAPVTPGSYVYTLFEFSRRTVQ